MRPSDSNDSTWECSPSQEYTLTLSHTGSIGSAVPEDVRKRKRGERGERRRRRRRKERGGASAASQEAGGRVAMQMGNIHIANHWSLSALQRKSLFRQNSRNWSYVPQPWFISPPSTLPVQSFPIHSPVWTWAVKEKKKAKEQLGQTTFISVSTFRISSLRVPPPFPLVFLIPFLVNLWSYAIIALSIRTWGQALTQPNLCLSIIQRKNTIL